MSNSDSKQKLVAIATMVIVALLASNAYFWYKYNQSSNKVEKQENHITEVEQLKADLEKQFYDAQKELDELKGDNEQLNLVIEDQKNTLAEQKAKISRLVGSGKVTKQDLESARAQLTEMLMQRDQMIAEINTLKNDKEALTKQAIKLTEEKTVLQTEVETEKAITTELTAAKATLVSQKEDLEAQALDLTKKVSIGSVIKVDDLDVTGWKIRKNGKPVKKKYAKNIDRLKICFTPESNELAAPGNEQFYIRLINPIGETLADENMGSSIFKNMKTDEDVRYTSIEEFEYNKTSQQRCMDWEPSISLHKGEYQIEVFNKGYLAGINTFALK